MSVLQFIGLCLSVKLKITSSIIRSKLKYIQETIPGENYTYSKPEVNSTTFLVYLKKKPARNRACEVN